MIASLFKSSVLKRYVGYYICLIAICVLILLVVYYVFLTNQFIAEMERTQSFKLEQAMETIDLRISEFGAIANSMIYDNYLTPFEFSQKENKRELIDRIASHKSRIEFIDTLIIHFFLKVIYIPTRVSFLMTHLPITNLHFLRIGMHQILSH